MSRGIQRLVPMKAITRRKHAIFFLILFTLCTTGTYWITCSLKIYDNYQCPPVKDIFYNLLHIKSSNVKYRIDIETDTVKKLESSEFDIDDLPADSVQNVLASNGGKNVADPKPGGKVAASNGEEDIDVPIVYHFDPAQGIAGEFNRHKQDLDLLSMVSFRFDRCLLTCIFTTFMFKA